LARSKFYRFFASIFPGKVGSGSAIEAKYLGLKSANNKFDNFRILPSAARWVGNMAVLLIVIGLGAISFSGGKVKSGNLADLPIMTKVERSGDVRRESIIASVDRFLRPVVVEGSTEVATGVAESNLGIETFGGTVAVSGFVLFGLSLVVWRKKRTLVARLVRTTIAFYMISSTVMSGWLPVLTQKINNDLIKIVDKLQPEKVAATGYQFGPTSGTLVTGTEQNVTLETAAATEGTNLGSWKATLYDDGLHWQVASTASGIDMQLNSDGVALNGANKMIIQTEIDLDATVPSLQVQICDWSSSTSIDVAEDAQCNDGDDDDDGAGWRILNTKDASQASVNYTDTGNDQLMWQIYDGYWSTGTTGGTAVSTPLDNFVRDSDGRVKIRYYATTNTTSVVSVDELRISAFIDSIYQPAGFTNLGSGTVAGTYGNAQIIGNTASTAFVTGDAVYITIAGTAGSISDSYFSFNNVETYTGMNTIYVRGEIGCGTSNAALEWRPKIYNFTTPGWENLTDTDIDCSTTDTTTTNSGWAKNNITITDYVSSGTIRVGFYGMDNGTHTIRVDSLMVMVGSTNTDTSLCEISMGTGTATNCSNTRDLDSTGTSNVFSNPLEDESTNMGTGESNSIYASDTDMDTTVEEAAAANISFPVTVPTGAAVVTDHFAGRFRMGSAGTPATGQLNLKDYGGGVGGGSGITGGWSIAGRTNATTSQTIIDSVTAITITAMSGLSAFYGIQVNPDEHIDSYNNRMNMRLRTSAGGTSTNNHTAEWDFAMVSIGWIENVNHPSKQHQFRPTGETLVTGTEQNITSATGSSNNGVNMGSWKGTLADDGFSWDVASTASGIDMQLNLNGVQLNGANKMIIGTEIELDATVPNILVQICDFRSSTSVDANEDAQCNDGDDDDDGGGWRTLNTKNASQTAISFTSATPTSLQWHIYDGYWSTGTTGGTAVSTPLANFINNTNNQVKIRYYSTVNTTSVVSIDHLFLMPFIDSTYQPSAFTNIGSGTVAGTYANAQAITNTASAQSSDDVRLTIAGTAGSVSDSYLSYTNVKTYTGMNTIYVRGEISCSTTDANLEWRPKIYNFNTPGWEDLTDTDIDCSTTDRTTTNSGWAKNNITVSNYISSGEMRVGVRGIDNGTHTIRIDSLYVVLGSTNTDSAKCEITIGTGTATNCTNTRDLDATGTTNVWSNANEDESSNMGSGESNSNYGSDTDHDASTTEEAAAANLSFSVTVPTNTFPVVGHVVGRFRMGSSGTPSTGQMGLRDFAGGPGNTTGIVGGWSAASGSSAATSQTVADSITAISQTAANAFGIIVNAEDHFDTYGNLANVRLRTTAAGADSNNHSAEWDFAMVSVGWIVTVGQYDQKTYRLFNNDNSADVGSALGAQDTAVTLTSVGQAFRLRLTLFNYGRDLSSSGENFKLQIAARGADNSCDTSFTNETYADISPSSGEIRFNDNAPADGNALTANANDPTHTNYGIRNQTYEESNNFTNSQSAVNTFQDGKWDFALVDNSAPANTTYCLRVVKSDATVLDTYTVIPQFTTVPENLWLLLAGLPILLFWMKRQRRKNGL
jgi:hypothetical protein